MVVIMLRCNFLCVIIITPGVPSPHPPVPPLTSLVFPALQSPHGLLSFYIPTLHASRSIFYGWLCTEVKVIQKPWSTYLRTVSCEDMDDDPCLPCIQVFTYVSFFLGVVHLYSVTDEFLHEDQHLEVRWGSGWARPPRCHQSSPGSPPSPHLPDYSDMADMGNYSRVILIPQSIKYAMIKYTIGGKNKLRPTLWKIYRHRIPP